MSSDRERTYEGLENLYKKLLGPQFERLSGSKPMVIVVPKWWGESLPEHEAYVFRQMLAEHEAYVRKMSKKLWQDQYLQTCDFVIFDEVVHQVEQVKAVKPATKTKSNQSSYGPQKHGRWQRR